RYTQREGHTQTPDSLGASLPRRGTCETVPRRRPTMLLRLRPRIEHPLRSALRRADDLLDQPVTVERLRELEEHPDGDRARDGPVPPEAGRALARVLRTDVHQYGGWSPMPMPVAHGSSAWPPAGAYPAPPHSCCWPPRPPPVLDFTRRSTFAEAYFNDGPISSTWSSTTDRFSPSRVSTDRCTSLPWAMTRMPFWSDSATFSAASRQMEQRRKSASPSFHSCVWRSKMRGVDAIVNDATATPDAVKRNSGSATRFPTTQMTVSPAIRLVPSSRCVRQPSRLGRCRGRSAIRRRRRGGRGPLRLRRG